MSGSGHGPWVHCVNFRDESEPGLSASSGRAPAEDDRFILHITSAEAWRRQRHQGDGFRDPSLEGEGFIHCSTLDQVLIPANERFAGRRDLVLLVVEVARIGHEVVYEDCYRSGMRFPHIYGPIPIDGVAAVVPFPPDSDGRFSEVPSLRLS